MSEPSDKVSAPRIPHSWHTPERDHFAGTFIGAILYGIVVVLFFRLMGALLNLGGRTRERVRWGLVAYVTTAFLFVTVFITTTLDRQSTSFINNRDFRGFKDIPSGPLGHQMFIYSKMICVIPNIMLMLNNWLADGLLLYRCCVIYAMNCWVVAFPCLMYLASLAMGIMFIYYEVSQPPEGAAQGSAAANFDYPYFTISLSLNILLTLMIITKFVLRSGNIRNAMGAPIGLRTTVITVIVESSALYAATYLLFIGLWSASSPVMFVFIPVLVNVQVIAPFLILLRVVTGRTLTSEIVLSGSVGSINSDQWDSTGGNEPIHNGNSMSSMDIRRESLDESVVGVEALTDSHGDEV